VTLNSFTHTGVVFSDTGEHFRVGLSLEPESDPRAGAPLFETPRSVAPLKLRLRAKEISGPSPIAEGAGCDFETRFMMRSKESGECKARLVCEGRTLYGDGEAGYGHCRLAGDRITTFSDDKESFRDSDPAVELDVAKGELVLRDSPKGEAWVAKLAPEE
jgi:hypothetical protein